MKLLIYQYKILFSPVKWLLSGAFIVFIPFIFYAPTELDVLNLYEIYVPFVSIILFPDMIWVDHYAHATEVLATRRRRGKLLLGYRFLVMLLFFIAMLVVGWLLLRLNLSPHGYEYSSSPLSFLTLLYVALPGFLFSGALSLSCGVFFRSPEIGYLAGLANWMYWNINMEQDNWLNLFSYANQLSVLPSKWTLSGLGLILIFLCGNAMFRVHVSFKLASRVRKGLGKVIDRLV